MPAGWYLVARLASRSLAALLTREGKVSCTALPSLGALGVSAGFPAPTQRQSLAEAYHTPLMHGFTPGSLQSAPRELWDCIKRSNIQDAGYM